MKNFVGAAVAAKDGGMPVLQEQKPVPAAIPENSNNRGRDDRSHSEE